MSRDQGGHYILTIEALCTVPQGLWGGGGGAASLAPEVHSTEGAEEWHRHSCLQPQNPALERCWRGSRSCFDVLRVIGVQRVNRLSGPLIFAVGKHQQLKHAAACRSMPQHLFLGPVGGGFEACHSMPQHTGNWVGTFLGGNIGPNYQSYPCAVVCQRWTVL